MRDTGAEVLQSLFLGLLAEAYLKDGQIEEGLATVAEALAFVDRTEERFYEAELWRMKGTLTLEARGWRLETSPASPQASSLKPQVLSLKSLFFPSPSNLSPRAWPPPSLLRASARQVAPGPRELCCCTPRSPRPRACHALHRVRKRPQ